MQYNKFHNSQNKLVRIADIFIPSCNRVLELQHSSISQKEVEERYYDYENLFNLELIWLLDGTNLKTFHISDSQILIIFNINQKLMYESFLHKTRWVYIDLKSEIIKFKPCDVKCDMIDVISTKILTSDFCDVIQQNNKSLDQLFAKSDEQEIIQCNMYLNQRGAGCGKTYESVNIAYQIANSNDPKQRFSEKKY
jgi:competence CoiA-like predicted nuclease